MKAMHFVIMIAHCFLAFFIVCYFAKDLFDKSDTLWDTTICPLGEVRPYACL